MRDDINEALTALENLADPNEVPGIAALLARTSIPFVATDVLKGERQWSRPEARTEPPIVIVRLSLNGTSLSTLDHVRRNALLNLTAEIKVSAWPDDASTMRLSFVNQVGPATLECPDIEIPRGSDHGETRLVLRADVHPRAPVEVSVAVSFEGPGDAPVVPRLLGDRTMRLATATAGGLPAGAEVANGRIIEMLAELDQALPDLPVDQRHDLTLLLAGSVTFAKAVQDGDVFGPGETVGEKHVMQPRLKLSLSGNPEIGHRLHEATEQATGITDLVLGQVVDELKVEHDTPVTIENASKHMSQPAHYAAVAQSQVSVLTILDLSPKDAPMGVEPNYMAWLRPALHGLNDPAYPSMVTLVIIPAGMPRPSDWQHRPPTVATSRARVGKVAKRPRGRPKADARD